MTTHPLQGGHQKSVKSRNSVTRSPGARPGAHSTPPPSPPPPGVAPETREGGTSRHLVTEFRPTAVAPLVFLLREGRPKLWRRPAGGVEGGCAAFALAGRREGATRNALKVMGSAVKDPRPRNSVTCFSCGLALYQPTRETGDRVPRPLRRGVRSPCPGLAGRIRSLNPAPRMEVCQPLLRPGVPGLGSRR